MDKNQKKSFNLEVRRAHTQMRGTVQYKGQKCGVVNFLKSKKDPYDYDVTVWVWDGSKIHDMSETGDEYLKNKNIFHDFIGGIIGYNKVK